MNIKKSPARKKTSPAKTYPKAPILEAICDISVIMPENFKVSDISNLSKHLKSEYPISQKLGSKKVTFSVNQETGTTLNETNEEQGMVFSSADRKYVIQLKRSGFTFSQVNSYDSWKHFKEKFWPLWELFISELKPVQVNKIGLRYVNRLDIPKASIKLSDYFNTCPRVMGDVEGAKVSGFFMQLQLPQKEGGIALVTQTIADPPAYGVSSIILDIDVIDFKDFDPNEGAVLKRIEKLRRQKNFIFENSITDLTRSIIS